MFFINKNNIFGLLSLILIIIPTIVNASSDNNQCLLCDFTIGAVIAGCNSVIHCKAIMIISILIVFLIGTFACIVGDAEKRRRIYNDMHSCRNVIAYITGYCIVNSNIL